MEKHVSVVAALQIGLGIFCILAGIIVMVIMGLVGGIANDANANMVLTLIGKIIVGVCIVLSIPGIIAGIGLLQHKEWARILTLVLSAINLMNVPVGTAIGIYSIWALVQEEVVALFRKEPRVL